MNEAVKNFLGEAVVKTLPIATRINPFNYGKKLPNNVTPDVIETREITFTPQVMAAWLMSNEAAIAKGKIPNRAIGKPRAEGELVMLYELMKAGEFAPHRGVLAVTEDGDFIEGQGRGLGQLKAGKTFTYTVDIVRSGQAHVANYLSATRGTTSTTSLSQLWEIYFGLGKKQAGLAQQIFNGILWHDEGNLGTNLRTSTKAEVCGLTRLPQDIRDTSAYYTNAKVPRNINAAALATLEVLAKRHGWAAAKVDAFRDGVLTGDMLPARDPRKTVREWLINRPKGNTVRFQAQIGYLDAALRKYMMGAAMNKIQGSSVVSFDGRKTMAARAKK
jgi:hypothetical protein